MSHDPDRAGRIFCDFCSSRTNREITAEFHAEGGVGNYIGFDSTGFKPELVADPFADEATFHLCISCQKWLVGVLIAKVNA